MPNWCNNNLTVEGPEEEVARFIVAARGKAQFYRYEFEKENKRLRKIGHPERTLADVEEEEEFCFHSLVPIPDDILEMAYDPHGYNKERELWGCKWGCSSTMIIMREKGKVIYTFQTPWSPPIEMLITASKSFSKLTFILKWNELGMIGAGRYVFVNGEIIEAEEYEDEEFEVVFNVKYKTKVTTIRSLLSDVISDICIPENECKYISNSFEVEKIIDSNGDEISDDEIIEK